MGFVYFCKVVVYAGENDYEDRVIPYEVLLRLYANGLTENDITDVQELYDYENNIIAFLFRLKSGYIISDINDRVIEYSFKRELGYSESKIYYAGPFSYYEQVDGNYINLSTGAREAFYDVIQKMNGFIEYNTCVIANEKCT